MGEEEVGSGPRTDSQLPPFVLRPLPPYSSPPGLLINSIGKEMAMVEIFKNSY